MRASGLILVIASIAVALSTSGRCEDAVRVTVGAAREDITPPIGLPMWGYGGRKDAGAQGTRDPLTVTAVVIDIGGTAIAVCGMDLGRAPARRTVASIRAGAAKAGVNEVFLVGSHTHHGPCVEVEDVEPTASWVKTLTAKTIRAIGRAAVARRPATLHAAVRDVELNRNRHSKIAPKPVDPQLGVLRAVDDDGETIAVLVNFAAHPTTLSAAMPKWSADYPGALRARVERDLGGLCAFLLGACGDLSTRRGRGEDTDAYGARVGDVAVALARSAERIETPTAIRLAGEEFTFSSRVDHENPIVRLKYNLAFFPALVDAFVREYAEGIRPNITIALLSDGLAFVGASGEVFCQHAVRLRERARIERLFFFGCCNGYHQYFPTIEAVAEGGYGADPDVSPVEVGAGERLMDRALFHLYSLRREIPGLPAPPAGSTASP